MVQDRQDAKMIVRSFFRDIERAGADSVSNVLSAHCPENFRMRCVHPFNEMTGTGAAEERFWRPLRQSFSRLQRREDIFMAGPDRSDGRMWVTSMGKFLGLFDRDWLGIPATRRIAMIPYCEFDRVEDGRIAESALWLDIVSLMRQVGLSPLPDSTGAEIVFPGPRTADGLLIDAQSETESAQTLDLIMRMCSDLVEKDGFRSSNSSLADTWHDDMLWFGPAGIGATYTIARYQMQHQTPFRRGLRDIEFEGHVLEHAEGNYGAWFGWPSLTMKQGDGFLGLPASERRGEMRVVDVYRRAGDKLAENWIFIDFLHYLKQLGVDVLERMASIRGEAAEKN